MRRSRLWILLLALIAAWGCATTGGPRSVEPRSEVGVASFYARRFNGRQTASGAFYDERKLTAAHPTLPFGTKVRVTHLTNDRSVVVTINDRGPWIQNRIIDLSRRAARELGLLRQGVARVRVQVLGR
jgi:rare lipoprotein A